LYSKATPEKKEPELTYNRDTRIPRSFIRPKDNSQYNPNTFLGPQDIFRDNSRSPPMRQPLPGESSRVADLFKPSTTEYRPSVATSNQEYNEQQFDEQINQLILKGRGLASQMAAAERETSPFKSPSFGSNQPFRYTDLRPDRFVEYPISKYGLATTHIPQVEFDRDALNKSVELEKIKLEIDDAALLGSPTRQPAPKNEPQETREEPSDGQLHFSEIDSLKINIMELDCKNENLRKRMADAKVFIEVAVPTSASTPENPIFDTYKFFAKDAGSRIWIFNNEINQAILPKDGEFKKLFFANVKFKVFIATPDKSNKIGETNLEVASGEMSLEKVILSPGYAGTFYIKLNSKVPSENLQAKAKTTPKKDTKATKVVKPAVNLVKAEGNTEVGELKCAFKFASSKAPKVTRVERPVESQYQSGGGFTPLQMLLYIEKIPKIIPREEKEFPFRNIYIAYKIYGSTERVVTDVRWKTNTPYIDHKMVFPISGEHISKMDSLPLILEVWDKNELSKDKIVGVVKISLAKAVAAILDPETQDINYEFIKASQFPLLIYDELLPITDLRTGAETGQVQLILALGTALQLNKFESRIKERKNGYSEVPEKRSYSPRGRPEEEKPTRDIPQEKKEEKREGSPFKKYEVEPLENETIPVRSGYEAFLEVLETLRRKADQYALKSSAFWMSKESRVPVRELLDFLMEPSYAIKLGFSKKVAKLLDVQNRGVIVRDYFTKSYDSYLLCEEKIRKKFSSAVNNLKILLEQQRMSVAAFEEALKPHSEYGYIKKPLLKSKLEEKKLFMGKDTLAFLLGMLDYNNDGYVFISHLTDYLKALDVYQTLNYLQLNPVFFMNHVSNVVIEVLKQDTTAEQIEEAFLVFGNKNRDITIEDVMQIFIKLGLDLSFWEAMSLMQYVKGRMNSLDENEVQINCLVLYNWIRSTIAPDIPSSQRQEEPEAQPQEPEFEEEIESVRPCAQPQHKPSREELTRPERPSVDEYKPTKQTKTTDEFTLRKSIETREPLEASPTKEEPRRDYPLGLFKTSPAKGLRDSQDSTDDLIGILNAKKSDLQQSTLSQELKTSTLEEVKGSREPKETKPTRIPEPVREKSAPKEGDRSKSAKSLYERQKEVKKEEKSPSIIQVIEKQIPDFDPKTLKEEIVSKLMQSIPKPVDTQEIISELLKKVQETVIPMIQERLPAPEPEKKVEEEKAPEKPPSQRYNRRIWKHRLTFSVQGVTGLALGQAFSGSQCAVRYMFPNTQDLIESNTIDYVPGTKDYTFDISSSHAWTLHRTEDLVEQLKNPSDGIVVQLVKKDLVDEVLGYTIIPLDDISNLVATARTVGDRDERSNQLQKSYILFTSSQAKASFSFQNELVLGKLLISIDYRSEHPIEDEEDIEDPTRQKETIYETERVIERTIPRKGYMNFKFDAITDLKRGLDFAIENYEEVKNFLDNKLAGTGRLSIYVDLFKDEPSLHQYFAPFEYELMKRQIDFNEIIIDTTVSKQLEINPELIDYIQNHSGLIEVRLYLIDDKSSSKKAITLCSAQLPLLQLLTSQAGIQGEFALTNQIGCYSGVISLNISFNKESKQAVGKRTDHLKGREKSTFFFLIGLNEIISLLETGDSSSLDDNSDTIVYFEFEVEGEIKRSLYYNFDKRKNKLLLTDSYFNFTLDSTSDFFRRPLEIKVIEKRKPKYQDRVLGLINLDFYNILKDHFPENKTWVQSFYCPVTDIEKAKNLKMRMGVKLAIVKVRNQTEARKLHNYLNTLLGGEVSRKTEEFRTRDAKMTGTITRSNLRDILRTVTIEYFIANYSRIAN